MHLVESWEAPATLTPNSTNHTHTRWIHAYTNGDSVELQVNGKSQGSQNVVPMVQGPGSYAEWVAVPFEAGTLTAVAKDAKGNSVATDVRHTNGKAAKLALSLDAPSKATGTGEALLLDGHDAALLRASIVDADGRVMHMATNNITFTVVSGPGRVQGSGNGDPHCHEPNNAAWHSAYHGLVRGVIRVTSTAGRSKHELEMMAQIDVHGPTASGSAEGAAAVGGSGVGAIVVQADSPGFAPVTISIPTSTDAATAGVMAVAEDGAGKPVDFFGHAAYTWRTF